MQECSPDQLQNAQKIAETLEDRYALHQHIPLVIKHKISFLWEMVNMVMSIPDHEIEKSRGAYYMHLVNKYGNSPDTWN